MTRIRMFLAVLLVLTGLTAATPAGAGPPPDMTPMGVGRATWVDSPQNLYQCPASYCNAGQAYPGNRLLTVCDVLAGGWSYQLVYNLDNGHTGFILDQNLAGPNSNVGCDSEGMSELADPASLIYQCPSFVCNQGITNKGDLIYVFCSVRTGAQRWFWTYNTANGHEGWRPFGYVDVQNCYNQ